MVAIKYTIGGIYGSVTFFKNLNIEESEITFHINEFKKTENHNDLFNFNILIRSYKTGEDIFDTKEPIIGLPFGVTEDMYFKMALINNLQSLNNKTENIEYITNINATKTDMRVIKEKVERRLSSLI